ncbi:MAG: PH domain-containing protein [Candidatus Methanoplasma sp.]|jgi:putative membrane protein|nr:PH domain-containing protein [Candidatus Methanoplasma sp.]
MTKLKNHFSVVVQNLSVTAIVLIFIFSSAYDVKYIFFILAAVLVAATALFVLFWSRTTIEFGDDGAVVESNVLFKRKKTIPYGKVASVNAVRNIFNRIFGTTTLQININSSIRAMKPEASFSFEMEQAERLRQEITSRLSVERPAEDLTSEPHASFTFRDSVEYGMIGVPTISLAVMISLLAYSLFSALFLGGSGTSLALILLVTSTVLPIVINSLKYSDFKVYRSENQIYLQHGAIQKYNTRFDISKINAVRIRRPLFARLLGKACLEAEVVGINAVSKETVPLLCLLVKERELDRIISDLIPEFVTDIKRDKQPKSSASPLLVKAAAKSVAILAVAAYSIYWLFSSEAAAGLSDGETAELLAIRYAALVVTLAAVLWMFYSVRIRLKVCEFGKGKDMFVLVNGIVDRETVIVQYDRVQIVSVSAGPLPRRLGLARGTISLLSSVGAKTIKTGYFRKEELSEIGDIMVERMSSGYDYRKNSI